MSKGSGGVHPEIGSLIRAKDEMWANLRNGHWMDALSSMWAILGDIQKKDDTENMFEMIIREQNKVGSMVDERQRREYLAQAKTAYRLWGRDIVQILWDKGYLENKKYNASGLEEFEKPEGWVEA